MINQNLKIKNYQYNVNLTKDNIIALDVKRTCNIRD